jgi:hypothetical protein
VMAVVAAGFSAAFSGVTIAWLLTPMIAFVILRAATKASDAVAQPDATRDLPPSLRFRVGKTLQELPAGDARQLLVAVVSQARPLYAVRPTAFDPTYDDSSRENATALVEACCHSALELARLDASFATRESSDPEPRYQPARELFARRLADAASALGALYASGVEHGTPASDRVAELVVEINADANARSAAGAELTRFLEDR